jgi:hypothetical protein
MYGFTYTKSQGVALVLHVLGDMPQNRFEFIQKREASEPLDIAPSVTPLEAKLCVTLAFYVLQTIFDNKGEVPIMTCMLMVPYYV